MQKTNYRYVLSTIAWVEKLAKTEIERQGWVIEKVIDRLITFSGDLDLMVKINLWSRVWNKVYLELGEKSNVQDFDTLFDFVNNISWKDYITKDFPIIVKSVSVRSELESAPSIQKISKKAIIKSINNWTDEFVREDDSLEKFEVTIMIIDNNVKVLLNTSWDALHMRWYRSQAWDAPIKENLAAALVLLSNWRFKENFYDPFCGSWTIAIEAAMIARNIAPWVNRLFAFEWLWLASSDLLDKYIKKAKAEQYNSKYNIFASDIDSDVLDIATQNSQIAWVWDTVVFKNISFDDFWSQKLSWTLVSNPPYWLRLQDENLSRLYINIDKVFKLNHDLSGWIITNYQEFDSIINLQNYKKRKLYNWGEKCYFYNLKK